MKYYKVNFKISSQKQTKQPLEEELLTTARDIVAALAGEAGFESFEENNDGLDGYVQTTLFEENNLEQQLQAFPMEDVKVEYTIHEAEDKDWNSCWEEEGFEPININNRCIVHDLHHPIPAEQDQQDSITDIVIDARQAFGTGTHQTTRMIISTLMEMDLKGKCLLDCGCGTGILSIAASKFGATRIVGYDIDDWSVENCKHNSQLNHVENIEVMLGDVHVLSHISGVFDIVMANINRNILLADMPHFKEVLSSNGLLILSGFYVEDGMKIAEKAGMLGMRLVKTSSEDNWCMLVFENEPGG